MTYEEAKARAEKLERRAIMVATPKAWRAASDAKAVVRLLERPQ